MSLPRPAALLAAIAAAALLAGCGVLTDPYRNRPSDGGRSPADAVAALEAIPGVENAEFWRQEWSQPGEGGLFSSSGMNFVLRVRIAPDRHVIDPEALLRVLAGAVWSVNDGYSPKGSVSLVIGGGLDVDYDWEPVARDVFETNSIGRKAGSVNSYGVDRPVELAADETLIAVAASDYAHAFGDWPAEPVAIKGKLLASGPPEPIDPPAVDDFSDSQVTGGGSGNCFSLSFARGLDEEGAPYTGDVTVTLYERGKEIGTEVSPGDDDPERTRRSVQFCDDDRMPASFDGASFDIRSEPQPGFRTIDLKDYRLR